jgi:hypothetical protein
MTNYAAAFSRVPPIVFQMRVVGTMDAQRIN